MGSYTFLNLQDRVSLEIQDTARVSVALAQVKAAIISAVEYYERERTWFNQTIGRSIVTVSGAPAVAVPTDMVFIDKVQVSNTSTMTADALNGSATLLNCTASPSVGQFITGTGIPASTQVKSMVGTTLTMGDVLGASVNATATNNTITVTIAAQSRYELDPITYDEWSDQSGTSTTGGQPTQYAYWQDRLYLYPTPGGIYSIFVSYVQRLATLSADSDNNGWTNFAEPLIRSRAKWDILAHLLYFDRMAQACKAEEIDTLQALDIERYQRNATGRTRAVYL